VAIGSLSYCSSYNQLAVNNADSGETGHPFRMKNRPCIPEEIGHPFRRETGHFFGSAGMGGRLPERVADLP
jgi:hypothetical protein